MKKLHELTLGAAFTLLALSACDNEALLPDAPQMNEPDNPNACVLAAKDFRWEGNESRTALTIEDKVAKFSWTTGDKVGILPDEAAQVYFTIPEAEALAEGDELTDAPELPTTTLADKCYQNMFNGCSSLSSITMLATDISASNCLYDWWMAWLQRAPSIRTAKQLGRKLAATASPQAGRCRTMWLPKTDELPVIRRG